MLQCEVIETVKDFDAISKQYQKFVDGVRYAHYEQDADFILRELNHSKKNVKLFIIIVRDQGTIVCCAPFRIQKRPHHLELGLYKIFKMNINILQCYGGDFIHNELNNIFAVYKIIFEKLQLHSNRFDLLIFYIKNDSDLSQFLYKGTGLKQTGFASNRHKPKINYHLKLAPNFKSYLAAFKYKRRYKLLSQVKKLKHNFDVALDVIEHPEQVDYFFNGMMAIFDNSWKKNNLTYTVPSRNFINFLAEKKILRSYLLKIDGQPIIFLYSTQHKGCFLNIETGYDRKWKKYSPGQVLHLMVLEDLHERNKPEESDYGYGESFIKTIFCNNTSYSCQFYIYMRGGKGYFIAKIQIIFNTLFNIISKFLKIISLDNLIRKIIKK